VTGCEPQTAEEKAKKDPLVQALHRVGLMYHGYHDAHAVGPANWEELASVAGSMSGDEQKYLDAIQTVKDKGYNVKWGVKFSSLTEGMINTVMAESPQGGPKLMFDGSVNIQ
jgi:hypothetical protein